MITLASELRDGQKNFFAHQSASDVNHAYYSFMSATGNSYIMRINTAGTETLYADGGKYLANWASKEVEPYVPISTLGAA